MLNTSNQNSQLAEINVTYSAKVKFKDMERIQTSSDCERVLRKIWNDTIELREEFYLLLLNRANRVLGWYRISQGGISGTVIDIRLIFSIALKANACGVVLAHNHPSGNTEPSQADLDLTRKIKEAGVLLEISVIDHLILTCDSFKSFADEGWL